MQVVVKQQVEVQMWESSSTYPNVRLRKKL